MSGVFNDMSVSERIRVLSDKYHKSGGHDIHRRAKDRERIGQEYGMTGRNIARYIRCEKLITGFKDMLDDGTLNLIDGVEMSFLSEKEQALVLDIIEQNGIMLTRKTVKKIRSAAGSITKELVQAIFGIDKPVVEMGRPVDVRIPAKLYSRYFANVAVKDVQGIVEEALSLYFERKGA